MTIRPYCIQNWRINSVFDSIRVIWYEFKRAVMNQKTTLVVLGVTVAIVASLALTPIVEEMAYAKRAAATRSDDENNGRNGSGGAGGNGARGSTSTHTTCA